MRGGPRGSCTDVVRREASTSALLRQSRVQRNEKAQAWQDDVSQVRRGATLKVRRDVTLGVMRSGLRESGTTLRTKALRDFESQARYDEASQVRIEGDRGAARCRDSGAARRRKSGAER